MTRYCYDSTTAADIPANAPMVAGYVDGIYRWSAADWARFPNAVKVRIAVNWTTNDGHVGDVEQGDMTPTTALSWVRMRRRNGVDPTLYCTAGTMSAIAQVFDGAGEPEPHYWIATLDGSIFPIGGSVVACQYQGQAQTGAHYDRSLVADFWPGVDTQEADMTPEQAQQLQDIFDKVNQMWADYVQAPRNTGQLPYELKQSGSVPPHTHSVTGTAQ